MNTKPKAYSYLRFSTPEQMKGDSLRRQTAAAAEYANKHGLELDTELSLRDLGVSAFRGANATTGALNEFLKAAEQGLVSKGAFLLVENLDRVSRDNAYDAQLLLQNIMSHDITVVTLMDGHAYSREKLRADPFGIIYAVLGFIRAHEESATKASRLKAAWVGKRLKVHERALTSLTPGWLKLDEHRKPVLIEDRAKVVRRIVKDTLRGIGLQSITRALNAEGVPVFGRAKYWGRSYVLKILQSPALIGTMVPRINEHRGNKLHRIEQPPVEGYFPAVIDADTYARLRDIKGAPKPRGRHATQPVLSILSGLARCPDCGGTMTRVQKGKRSNPSLACVRSKEGAAKHYHGVQYAPIEDVILRTYEAILADMPHPDAAVGAGLSNAEVVLDELQTRMGDLMGILERRPSDALATRVAELELTLKEARADYDQWAERAARSERKSIQLRVEALGVSIRARPLDRARINTSLRELVEHVTVDYRSGHLVFRWRSGGESSVFFMWPRAAAGT